MARFPLHSLTARATGQERVTRGVLMHREADQRGCQDECGAQGRGSPLEEKGGADGWLVGKGASGRAA